MDRKLEAETRRIAQEEAQKEVKECFEQLVKDVTDIKQALLGNDYNHDGIVSIVKSHEEYIEKNKATLVAERGLKVIEWYERLDKPEGTGKKSKLQILEDGIKGLETIGTLKRWAVFFGITNAGTLIALITTFIQDLQK